MLIFGHPWIESRRFVKVFSLDEIEKTKTKDILLMEPMNVSIDLVHHCRKERLPFAVTIGTLKEALLANSLEASYILCQHEQAIEVQKIAEKYLFDTRILVLIEDERQIENMARFGIDGVVFPQAIVQI